MIQTEKLDLREAIRTAIIPLTEDGDFDLNDIKFLSLSHFETIIVELCSEKLDISFIYKLGFRKHFQDCLTIDCSFTVKPSNLIFSAIYLKTAHLIDLSHDEDDYVQELEISENDTLTRNGFPPEIKEYLQELNHECIQVKKMLPDIRAIFSSENIDETIRLYSQEYRKFVKEGHIF